MSTINLLSYNNYYNRQVKQEATFASYLTYQVQAPTYNVNFNPNDGVDTELIISLSVETIPDYLVVGNDTNNDIDSRWFILECSRLRSGQYKLGLKRDVIVDNYSDIITSPMFVEKAKLESDNKLIFNQEEVAFNQIKTSETLLKDETDSAWLVGYISRTDPTDLKIDVDYQAVEDLTINGIDNYFNKYASLSQRSASGTWRVYNGTAEYYVRYNTVGVNRQVFFKVGIDSPSLDITSNAGNDNVSLRRYLNNVPTDNSELDSTLALNFYLGTRTSKSTIASQIEVYPGLGRSSASSLANIFEDNGKVIKDTATDKYYLIEITQRTVGTNPVTVNSSSFPTLYQTLSGITAANTGYYDDKPYRVDGEGKTYGYIVNYVNDQIPVFDVNLTETQLSNFEVEIPASTERRHLVDAPYDMFCMPYPTRQMKIYHNTVEEVSNLNAQLMLSTAMSMAKAWSGASFLYDIQLLPYCPLGNEFITATGDIDYKNMVTGKIGLHLGESSESIYGRVFFLKQSEFQFSIAYNISIEDPKVENQTDMYRLCSPNYSGMFEFNAARNGGVEYIDVDCNYKPYSPYIHLNPQFKMLYGSNFHDARGLICSGDFSLPIVSDQWSTYELQNKNYENTFQRQLQNMDVTYKINKHEAVVSGAAGIFTGAVTAGAAGSVIGGGLGAMAGSAIGSIFSTAGMKTDLENMQKRQDEAVSYNKDIHQYQLQNIQALPNTLTKVGALNANFKKFPFIEYYTCTQEEKNAFKNKIKYEGMQVGIIDTISNYIYTGEKNFLKGKLIRIDSLADDAHMATAIAQELSQGVYI